MAEKYNKLEKIGRAIIFTIFRPIIWFCEYFNISPNVLTSFGLLINIAATVIFIIGAEYGTRENLYYFGWGGFTVLLGGVFDMLDGYIARKRNISTKFGALYDSVLDRYSELFMFFGIAFFLVSHSYFFTSVATFLALIGSVMVSYIRARAEGLKINCSVGFMQRPLRIIVIGFAAVFSGLYSVHVGQTFTLPFLEVEFEPITIFTISIIVVAIFANLTAIQRLYYSYKELTKN